MDQAQGLPQRLSGRHQAGAAIWVTTDGVWSAIASGWQFSGTKTVVRQITRIEGTLGWFVPGIFATTCHTETSFLSHRVSQDLCLLEARRRRLAARAIIAVSSRAILFGRCSGEPGRDFRYIVFATEPMW
jgi:hypothetical protein